MAVPDWIKDGGDGIVMRHNRWGYKESPVPVKLKIGKRYVTTVSDRPAFHALRFDGKYGSNRMAHHPGSYSDAWYELIDPADTEYLEQLADRVKLSDAEQELKTAIHKCSTGSRQSVEQVRDSAITLLNLM